MPSVSPPYAQSIVNYLVSLGFNEIEITTQVSAPAVPPSSSRVSMQDYVSLLNKGALLTNNSLFGFELGKHIQAKDYGVLGYLVESCENLAQAIQALTRFDALVANIGNTTVVNESTNVHINWKPKSDDCKQMVLRNTTAWVATVYKILGQACQIHAITFTFPLSVRERGTLEAWFNCDVMGEADTNAIIFPQSLLHIPFTSENRAMFSALIAVTETELRRCYQQGNSPGETDVFEHIRVSVEALLKAQPTLKECNQQRIASALFISPRTLQRKLKLSGTSFQQLLNDERKCRLDELLKHHSIADTADLLGFKEQSSFTHAFKKWYSTTPLRYQKQLVK